MGAFGLPDAPVVFGARQEEDLASMLLRIGAAAFAFLFVGQAPGPTRQDWDWLNANREAALEWVMSMQLPGVVFAHRSYRDLYTDVPERYLAIEFVRGTDAGEAIPHATIITPVGPSIQQQILSTYMRDRHMPFSSVVANTRVHRVAIDGTNCPILRRRIDTMPPLALSLAEVRTLRLHPMLHRILVQQDNATIDVTITDEEHPVVRWVLETYETLTACTPAMRS